jgi:phage-related protein
MVSSINYTKKEVIKMVWLIDNFEDLGKSIATYISEALEALINALIHPVIYLITWLGNIVKLIFDAFTNLFNTIWNTFNILYDFTSNIFTQLFPNVWTTIILLGISILFLLRLYYFIKDISILGNKI